MTNSRQHVLPLLQKGIALHQSGQLIKAKNAYSLVLQLDPKHAGALHLLGVTFQQSGEIQRAIETILRAISIKESPIFLNNLGVAYLQARQVEAAHDAFCRAVELRPNYADAWANLAISNELLGQFSEAETAAQKAIAIAPKHVDALLQLGRLQHQQGDLELAVETYLSVANDHPREPAIQNKIGNLLQQLGQASLATECFQRAIAIDSQSSGLHHNLGRSHGDSGNISGAKSSYETASRLPNGQSWWRWKWLGHCPTVFRTANEIAEFRETLLANLVTCKHEMQSVALGDPLKNGFSPPFNLSHHGLDNRRIKEAFANVFAQRFDRPQPRPNAGKPRIGFIATQGHEGSLLRGLGKIIRGLSRKEFQPVAFCSATHISNCQRQLAADGVEWVSLPDNFYGMVNAVEGAKCDVLYYRQVGMDCSCYFLPMTRLAPVQCTSWGSHLTTGLSTIDYFISSDLIEIEDAQQHYTEQLIRFPGLVASVAPKPPAQTFSREDFGLPEQGGLFLVPQRPGKLHPDFDHWLAEVLDRCHESYVVLFSGSDRGIRSQLVLRMKASLGNAFKRVIFMPRLTFPHLLGLMSVCDAMLDIPQYNGSFTTSDAFSVGLPLVTIAGDLKVERYGHFFYRLLGLPEYISNDREQYIRQAQRLAEDADYRHEMSRQIVARNPVLYEHHSITKCYEDFFLTAITNAAHSS